VIRGAPLPQAPPAGTENDPGPAAVSEAGAGPALTTGSPPTMAGWGPATRAGVEEGIVPGGGVALLNAMKALDGLKLTYDDENTGIDILRRALEAPIRKLAENAGQNGAVIIQAVQRAQADRKDDKIGYDVMTGAFVNMIEAGIIDPAKVTRGALENAASIAAMILTTEALVTDAPEKKSAAPMPGGGGGDMYD